MFVTDRGAARGAGVAKPHRRAGLEGASILPTSSTKLLLCRIMSVSRKKIFFWGWGGAKRKSAPWAPKTLAMPLVTEDGNPH